MVSRKWLTYLLCFDKEIGSKAGHAQHYVGSTPKDRIEERMQEHRSGNGARIMKAVVQDYGLDFQVVRTWEFDTKQEAISWEMTLKRRREIARYCPEHRSPFLAKKAEEERVRRTRIKEQKITERVKQLQAWMGIPEGAARLLLEHFDLVPRVPKNLEAANKARLSFYKDDIMETEE